MSHTDVKAALAHGIGLINAWKHSEEQKIAAAKAAHVANDGGVRALTEELHKLSIEEKHLPNRFFGGQLILRNHHGKNLRAHDSGKLEHHENKGGWEQWVFEDAKKGDGSFYICNTALGFQLQAHDGKVEVKTTKNKDAWEQYKIADAPGAPGKFMLVSHHGTHLSQTDGGLLRQSPNSAAWEFWDIQFASGASPVAARRADTEHKLAGARKASSDAADAAERAQRASLEAEVGRRIAAKNDLARRIEGELASLAGP
jgi:hypothetical protein